MKYCKAVAFLFISMFIPGCPQTTRITPQPPVVTDQAMCPLACEHIGPTGLKCEEGNPIDMKKACNDTADCMKGAECFAKKCIVSCTQFCIDTENVGVWLDPGCVAGVTSCNEIETCPMPVKK